MVQAVTSLWDDWNICRLVRVLDSLVVTWSRINNAQRPDILVLQYGLRRRPSDSMQRTSQVGAGGSKTHQALAGHAGSAAGPAGMAPDDSFLETKSITLEWSVSNLKNLFDSSRGDAKSRCIKSGCCSGSWYTYYADNHWHSPRPGPLCTCLTIRTRV